MPIEDYLPTPESPTRPTVRVDGCRKRLRSLACWYNLRIVEFGSLCNEELARISAKLTIRFFALENDCWNAGSWNRSRGGNSSATVWGGWSTCEPDRRRELDRGRPVAPGLVLFRFGDSGWRCGLEGGGVLCEGSGPKVMFFIPSAIPLTVGLRVFGISFGELIRLRREYADSLPVVGRVDSLEDADGVCAPDGP